MKTRIQVEHPASEAITGIDIVAEQVRIAAVHRWTLAGDDFETRRGQRMQYQRGNAVRRLTEARDDHGFPSLPGGPGIRVDTYLERGANLLRHYNSLMLKLIAYSKNRNDAIARMRSALSELVIEGAAENSALQERILADAAFVAGNISIHQVENQKVKLAK